MDLGADMSEPNLEVDADVPLPNLELVSRSAFPRTCGNEHLIEQTSDHSWNCIPQTYAVYTLLSLISLSSAEDTSALYIFGDSGVDAGNNLYINTLAKPVFPNGIDFGKPFGTPSGRYSNGRISVDFIVSTAQELGLKNFPPPYLAPTTVGDVLLNGVSYASSGSGILNETGSFFGGVISLENQIRYFNRTRQDIISNIGIRDAN
ncbi:hypothetical protein Peur_041695 [Populus x canadensis]